MIGVGTRVAVVDDVPDYAETAAGIAEEAGLTPTIIEPTHGSFSVPNDLLEQIRTTRSSAVICDHRLSDRGFASFTGAEFVSALYQERIPAVLLSTFSSIDDDTSIRLHRVHIPSLVDRSFLDPEIVIGGLERCDSELSGIIAPDRKSWRTLVRIEGVSQESSTAVADAIIHTWNPVSAVRFPLELIEDRAIRENLCDRDTWPVRLFARVNVGCHNGSELYFQDFESAPEPCMDYLAS
ncbi:MAG: hypothetical protein OXG65_14390 [Chloroflexi bacterium]|nr:hypothetical protein [Chloroflexota bacterium]